MEGQPQFTWTLLPLASSLTLFLLAPRLAPGKKGKERVSYTPATINSFYFPTKLTTTAAQPFYGPAEVEHSVSNSAVDSVQCSSGQVIYRERATPTLLFSLGGRFTIQGQPSVYNVP